MSFNLFGAASNNDIRVGYIDPERGYVRNVTISEANQYAALNPGHTFILETRDKTRYLTINQVNALTPADILPSSSAATGTCGGVQGLRPDDLILDDGEVPVTYGGGANNGGRPGGGTGADGTGLPVGGPGAGNVGGVVSNPGDGGGSSGPGVTNGSFIKANPARIKITGGGGVGAVANPIFGRDGSLLAVDLVRGGFGYKYPPLVKLVDDRGRGSGAILKAIVGSAVSVTEYYDLEEDFEEYNFGPELPGYGNVTDPDGKTLGAWDPTLFASLEVDTIGQEIQAFQEFLASGISPFWHTRKEKPLNVSFRDRTSRVVHEVEHPAWEPSFMNGYAISPVPPSNVRGSDYAGRVCTFEWEENFPYDGVYTFKALCDNSCKVYIDNNEIMAFGGFRGAPQSTTYRINEGVHQIKIDLLNHVQYVKRFLEPVATETKNEELLISYRGMSPGSGIRREKDNLVRIDDNIGNGFDENARFQIKSSTVNARFSDDGKKILYKGSGEITIMYRWDDNPVSSGLAVTDIIAGGQVWERTKEKISNNNRRGRVAQNLEEFRFTEKGSVTHTIKVKGAKTQVQTSSGSTRTSNDNREVFNTVNFMGRANRKLWRTNVYGRGGFINEYGVCPFDTRNPLEDNPYAGTHRIQWDNIEVPVDGNYNIEVAVDDTVDLSIIESSRATGGTGGDPVVIQKKGFKGDSSKSTGVSSYTRFLRKGKHKIIADLYQKPGGRFSFNPASTSKKATISARFRRNGNEYEMVVDGSGTAEIDFSLRMDDNPDTAGDSLSSVEIGLPPNDYIKLKRTRRGSKFREKEVITGSARFEAGRTYPVRVNGRARRGGTVLRNANSLGFDDNIDNGFDLNGELKINRLKNIKPASVKGINPMMLAVKITLEQEQGLVISPQSWNNNPMGVAMTIDAPIPEPPQEPPIVGQGRCPNNPIWTTRSANSSERWYPVTLDARWSAFTNRFALSPIPPRVEPGTDGPNINYVNSWDINIPYRGYYGIKGTCDNRGRILIDGDEVYRLEGFKKNSPSTRKILLEEGPHTITVEVLNYDHRNFKTINKQFFSTKEWGTIKEQVEPPREGELLISYRNLNPANKRLNVKGNVIKLKDGHGNDTNARFVIESSTNTATFSGDGRKIKHFGPGIINLLLEWDDNPNTAGTAVESIEVGGQVLRQKGEKGKEREKVTVQISSVAGETDTSQTRKLEGVTYEGPRLFDYNDKRWGDWMNEFSVSPYELPLDKWLNEENPRILKDRTLIWKNVNFSENGNYVVEMMADNIAKLYINDVFVKESRGFRGDPVRSSVNLSAGTYDVKIELVNGPTSRDLFSDNPSGVGLRISKNIDVATNSLSWRNNPVGVSAIMIPPPCPKVIEGKGVVTDIIADEPGQGYPQPTGADNYPVTLQLTSIVPTAKGINYGPDDVVLVNGTPIGPAVLGPFGTVESIPIPGRYLGYTEYPNITMPSDTGIGFRGRPVFTPIVIPQDVLPPEDILQVTDLVGLKQTGYVNGKPYYGQVFYKEGVRYAGVFETVGELIQVYDTLQESIDAQVTTAPSAILRQGTDVTNNDPRLNIPGTPDNLT